MTYDDMINGGFWHGDHLALRRRMAEYIVDDGRLGARQLTTRSGSLYDSALTQTDSEILTAALTLAHLGYEQVNIRAHGDDGKPLEKPDIDATINGAILGIEIAEVPDAPKHEAMKERIELAIDNMLHDELAFREAFGNHYLSVNLNPIGRFEHIPIEGKREADALRNDLEAFIRAGLSVPNDGRHLRPFPAQYTALVERSCEYNISEMASGPYFDLGDGPGSLPSTDRTSHVLRVLDKHRASARKNYRTLPETWIVLYLPDAAELFRRTAEVVAAQRPAIAPFRRCLLVDSAGRVEDINHANDAAAKLDE